MVLWFFGTNSDLELNRIRNKLAANIYVLSTATLAFANPQILLEYYNGPSGRVHVFKVKKSSSYLIRCSGVSNIQTKTGSSFLRLILTDVV